MRRSRAHVKPNIGPTASKKEEVKAIPKVEKSPPPLSVTSDEVVTVETTTVEPPTVVAPEPSPHADIPSTSTAIFIAPAPPPPLPSPPVHISHHSPIREYKPLISPRSRVSSTCSTFSISSTNSRREKRKFTGDEDLDPKSMRMVDLIAWNPRKEKKLDRSKFEQNEIRSEIDPAEVDKPAAPQLKFDESGKLVVDETSLVVDGRASHSAWDTVEESLMPRKISSTAFRRTAFRRGTTWSEKETDLFYEVLRSTGSDFGLMHDFFPRRARNELKSKFNREERLNWARVNEVLANPIILSSTLYEKVATLTSELEQEEKEKRDAKEKKQERKEKKIIPTQFVAAEEDEWKEENADLEAEAFAIITELEDTFKKKLEMDAKAKEERKQKSKKKRSTPKGEKTPISEKAKRILKSTRRVVARDEEIQSSEKEKKDATFEGYPESDGEESSVSSDASSWKPKRKGRMTTK